MVNRLRLIGEIEKISSRYPHTHPSLPIDYQNYKTFTLIHNFTTGQRNLLMRPAPLSHMGVLKMEDAHLHYLLQMHNFPNAKKQKPHLPCLQKEKTLFCHLRNSENYIWKIRRQKQIRRQNQIRGQKQKRGQK